MKVDSIVINIYIKAQGVVNFYNSQGAAEQWIKEDKYALNQIRISCKRFGSSQESLRVFVLAYNPGNFLIFYESIVRCL